MRVLLVAHSSIAAKPLHEKLSNAIKESGEKWWHYLDSVWLVKTDKSSHDVGMALRDAIGSSRTNILVIEVIGFAQGALPEKAWDWINENVPDLPGLDDL